MELRRIAVYCGSSHGASALYAGAARDLGRALVSHGLGLVYGGASVGLMGLLADTVLQQGGHVIGVIPQQLVNRELAHTSISDLRIVHSMHERKQMMAHLADAFIAMPGGIGTMEEFFEVWTWSHLGVHAKACSLLNVGGYYDPLLKFLDGMVEAGFLKEESRAMVIVEQEPTALIEQIEKFQPPTVPKWLDDSEM